MAIDRESTIRRAEKLLKQGRLEAAIAEYAQAVEDQPRDWNTANLLGDLYVKTGQIESAVQQYARVAEHFAREGFLQKAAALYKKIVKIKPNDERVLLELARLSEHQGLIADAKACLSTVAERRRRQGDRRGSAEVLLRLAKLDPADAKASALAARAAGELGDTAGTAARSHAMSEQADERAARDGQQHLRQARAWLASGQLEEARAALRAVPGGGADAAVRLIHAEIELRAGHLATGREALRRLLEDDASLCHAVFEIAGRLGNADAAFVGVDLASDTASVQGDYEAAAAGLRAFISRVPGHLPALVRLVEAAVDGGLDATMCEAQAQLADAYLSEDRAAEARVIAEGLVAREPWQPRHIERLRRALVALAEPEPDRIIADHLSGRSPFAGTELLMEPGVDRMLGPGPARGLVSEPEGGAPEFAEIEIDVCELAAADSDPATHTDIRTEQFFDEWLDQVATRGPSAEVPSVAPDGSVDRPSVGDQTRSDMAVGPPAGAAPDVDDRSSPVAFELRPVPDEPSLVSADPVLGAVVEGADVDLSDAIDELRSGLDAPDREASDAGPAPGADTTADLEEVFRKFREEAAARGLAESGEQHLRLAVAFRDIGMTDDCVKALEVAARSPRHRFEAAAMLAQTLRAQGRIRDAVEWFERAAETAAPSAEAGRQVLYELARTLSDAGEAQRALAVFLELQADAPDYRDVGLRVQRLSSTS